MVGPLRFKYGFQEGDIGGTLSLVIKNLLGIE